MFTLKYMYRPQIFTPAINMILMSVIAFKNVIYPTIQRIKYSCSYQLKCVVFFNGTLFQLHEISGSITFPMET